MKKLTIDQIKEILKRTYPYYERESIFLTPNPQTEMNVIFLWDALREMCETPLDEIQFNALLDETETILKTKEIEAEANEEREG